VLNAVGKSECDTYPSVGLGSDLRLLGLEVISAGLVWENRILHLGALKTSQKIGSRMGSPGQRRRNTG
jgi:hypothetical protein